MNSENDVLTYHVWFRPEVSEKTPPSYQIYLSASQQYAGLFNATIVARNADTPTGQGQGNSGAWNKTSLTSLDELWVDVQNELMALNPGKQINHSTERWLERTSDPSS